MSVEIKGQTVLEQLELDGSVKATSRESMKYTRAYLLLLCELNICRELPPGFEPSILRHLKYSYTRDFLLSINDLHLCKKLPDGIDQSLLRPSIGILETPRRHICIPRPNTGDSYLQVSQDSDSGSYNRGLYLNTVKKAQNDGPALTGAYPRVPSCASEVLAPKIQENCHYQLKKSDNPYRPPHLCKVGNINPEDNSLPQKISPTSNMSCDNQDEKKSESRNIHVSVLNVNKIAGLSTSEEVYNNVVGGSSEIVGASIINKDETKDCSVNESRWGMTPTTFGLEQSKHSIKKYSAISDSDFRYKKSSPEDESECYNLFPLLQDNAPQPLVVSVNEKGSSDKCCYSSADNDPELHSFANKESPEDSEETKLASRIGVMKEFLKGLSDETTRYYSSEARENPVPPADDNFFTLMLDEWTNSGGFGAVKFPERDELYMIKQSESGFDDAWAEIWSLYQMEKKLSLSTVVCDETENSDIEIFLPDVDNLFQIKKSENPGNSASSSLMEQGGKLRPVAGYNHLPDMEVGIHLPDEEYLISYEQLMSTSSCSSVDPPDYLAVLNVTQGDKETDVSSSDWPLFVDSNCSRTSFDKLHSKTSHSQRHKGQKNLKKPSVYSLDSYQAQMTSQIKLMDVQASPSVTPTHSNSRKNACTKSSHETPHGKPKVVDYHLTQFSLLHQPSNMLPQQEVKQLKGAKLSNPAKKMAYTQDLNPKQVHPFQGFGMHCPDFGVI